MMCENHWWDCYGPFKPWHECTSRPDTAEVLHFFLGKREIRPEEHVPYLSNLFGLQKSMVYNILKGDGLDSIIRCRQLVQALQIHPPLFGIDARFYPIERYPYWWRAYGFDFHADAEGYPVLSEVIQYLRLQRAREDEKGRVRVWSQEDLGDATGLKKETIYRMEHDLNPLILENMSRRALVALALGTLAGDQEPTIFRLFGLDPQAYGVPVPIHECIAEVHGLPEHLTDKILYDYHQTLASFFTEYYAGHAQKLVTEAHEWLRRLEMLQFRASTTAELVQVLALQCRYHQFFSALAREQQKAEQVAFHTDTAVRLAEQAMQLPRPNSCEQAFLTLANELVATALFWRADAYYEGEEYILAQADIDRALDLLPAFQSIRLKMQILAEAGLIHAQTAQNEMDRARVLSYFNLAAQLNTPGKFQPVSASLDDQCSCGPTAWLALYKAMALSAPPLRGTTAESVHDLLEAAQKATPPELLRQHTLITVFLAWDAFVTSDYRQAIEAALDALEKSRQIRSHVNRDRIAALYIQLLQTKSRDEPYCSYLGVKLRTWEHGIG